MGRRQTKNQANFGELILFVLIILCIYFILSLFDSPLAGDGGREWGKYLRKAWGGALIVPLMFWLYLCAATLLKFRIPRIPRQILGTFQLYISFAFLLGLLKETGWESERTLFLPGNFGHGLARFFILNVGTFITLLLIAGSFILSAFFFGSKILKLNLPSIPSIKLPKRSQSRRLRRKIRDRKDEESNETYPEYSPEDILFMKKIKTPSYFRNDDNDDDDFAHVSLSTSKSKRRSSNGFKNIQMPILKPAPNLYEDENEEESTENKSPAIEKIDDILAMIESGALEPPEKKRSKPSRSAKKLRRPLPEISIPEFNENFEGISSEIQASKPKYDKSIFPPPLEIFGQPVRFADTAKNSQKNSDKQGKIIISTLKNFGITASLAHIVTGFSVIQYQIELAPGMKVNKISGLSEEISMALAVMSVRIEAPIPGTHYVGIEIPNEERKFLPLRNVLESGEFQNSEARLPVPMGISADGKIVISPLEELPHLLIAGDKGSGKNNFMNDCILSICSKQIPEDLRLILIDPRHIEFAIYNDLPHLLTPVVSDIKGSLNALQWAYDEMEKRTGNFAKERVKNLASFNKKLKPKERLPEIVIMIAELSDLMYSAGNEFEDLIVRLAQKGGAAGIYMILSTQRPSADVVTTLIRSNIPARAAFTLSSQSDSKNILGITDAEKLTGKGDILFKNSTHISRLQTPFISEERISEFVEYMANNIESSEQIKF